LKVSAKAMAWIAAIAVNGGLLLYFHNRFWLPADDGLYAHVADRVLHGGILHRDFQYFCPDLDVWVNTTSLWLFGEDFVSLRYPLVLASFLQACLIFLLFSRYSLAAAFVASTVSTALGVLQFLNPTHHWYALLGAIVAGCYLTWNRASDVRSYFWAGLLVGVIFCFRQPTAVFVAMAIIGYFLQARHDGTRPAVITLASGLSGLMAIALLMYLYKATDGIGFLLLGFWPLCILLWLAVKVRVSNREVLRILAGLAAGGVVILLPLVVFHAAHGSLAMLLRETVLNPVSIVGQSYFSLFSYDLILQSVQVLLSRSLAPADILNAVYWCLLLAIPFASGALCFYHLTRLSQDRVTQLVVPLTAVFYGLVSVHLAIPIYLYFSVGFSLVALLWMLLVLGHSVIWLRAALGISVVVGLVAVIFHAAQPIAKDFVGAIDRNKTPLVFAGGTIPKLDLWIAADDLKTYRSVLDVIDQYVAPSETVFALPYNPEIYFLSGRKNPFRFYSIECALYESGNVDRIIRELHKASPAMICYVPKDKRTTQTVQAIMSDVKVSYQRYGTVGDFEIYLRPDVVRRNNH
jgi:hypothetical protein